MYLITVLVEYEAIQQQFTYHYEQALPKYVRVLIPFHNQEIVGFVVDVKPFEQLAFETKKILQVIDEKPILNDELVKLAYWMEKQYFTTLISCFHQILPKKLQPKKSAKKPSMIAHLEIIDAKVKKAKHEEIIQFLVKHPNTPRSELKKNI